MVYTYMRDMQEQRKATCNPAGPGLTTQLKLHVASLTEEFVHASEQVACRFGFGCRVSGLRGFEFRVRVSGFGIGGSGFRVEG